MEGLEDPGTSKADQIITLGAKQNISVIEDLLVSQGTDPAFTSFCHRVSLAIQALTRTSNSEPADTISISDSQEVQSFIS